MRTGSDGRYEFRTIKPAAYPLRTEPAHIHLTMSAANHPEYSGTIWFADDPLITPTLRASNAAIAATRTMRPAVILTLVRDASGVLRGTHDIRLERVTN
jgi:protocatechuate 3,4-dioxygenase beta subunit